MKTETAMDESIPIERQQLDVDIACVGFGPATGGFLTTLSHAMAAAPDDPTTLMRCMEPRSIPHEVQRRPPQQQDGPGHRR